MSYKNHLYKVLVVCAAVAVASAGYAVLGRPAQTPAAAAVPASNASANRLRALNDDTPPVAAEALPKSESAVPSTVDRSSDADDRAQHSTVLRALRQRAPEHAPSAQPLDAHERAARPALQSALDRPLDAHERAARSSALPPVSEFGGDLDAKQGPNELAVQAYLAAHSAFATAQSTQGANELAVQAYLAAHGAFATTVSGGRPPAVQERVKNCGYFVERCISHP